MSSRKGVVELIIALALVVFLLGLEYYSHDCDKKYCSHWWEPPEEEEDLNSYVDKLVIGIRGLSNWVQWRQALIIAILATPIIIYLLFQRLPNLYEWITLVLVIFILASLSSSWLWFHYIHPGTNKIERSLLNLKYSSSS